MTQMMSLSLSLSTDMTTEQLIVELNNKTGKYQFTQYQVLIPVHFGFTFHLFTIISVSVQLQVRNKFFLELLKVMGTHQSS